MFLSELTPVLKELTQQPTAFVGGFFSGILRLNLEEDPVKSWLEKNGVSSSYTTAPEPENNEESSGPQSITIE
ncbi:MAG: hypothetical protein SXA11_18215 [Cyanobacteriota bacterium]|nr:hypothetical protein [Cyanobacteriota bacterium]